MGLDTYLIKEKPKNEYTSLQDWEKIEVGYWRKCYGINDWLKRKSGKKIEKWLFEFPAEILKPIVEKMEVYIDKLIKKANELGYSVENVDDLWSTICTLDESNSIEKDLETLDKVIYSFNIDDLDYSVFDDSIWSALSTFIQTYNNFKRASQEPVLYYGESF